MKTKTSPSFIAILTSVCAVLAIASTQSNSSIAGGALILAGLFAAASFLDAILSGPKSFAIVPAGILAGLAILCLVPQVI